MSSGGWHRDGAGFSKPFRVLLAGERRSSGGSTVAVLGRVSGQSPGDTRGREEMVAVAGGTLNVPFLFNLLVVLP